MMCSKHIIPGRAITCCCCVLAACGQGRGCCCCSTLHNVSSSLHNTTSLRCCCLQRGYIIVLLFTAWSDFSCSLLRMVVLFLCDLLLPQARRCPRTGPPAHTSQGRPSCQTRPQMLSTLCCGSSWRRGRTNPCTWALVSAAHEKCSVTDDHKAPAGC
jgi:hypothetical protein